MKTTRENIKKLRKDGFTGTHAGMLVFKNSWVTARGDQETLTRMDARLIESVLKTQTDLMVYNALVGAYDEADHLEKQCYTSALAATACLGRINRIVAQEDARPKGGLQKASGKSGAAISSGDGREADLSKRVSVLYDCTITELRRVVLGRQVLREIGRVFGMNLEERLDVATYGFLYPEIELYNKHTRRRLTGGKVPPPITLEKIRLPAREIAAVRAWFSNALGDGWWEQPVPPDRKLDPMFSQEMQEELEQLRKAAEDED